MATYFFVQQANALLKSQYSNEDSFSTICVNVRSLINPHNFSKFESLISGLDFQPHLIAVNETWEKPHAIGQHKSLNGYVYIFNPRVVSRGGGVGMYITQNLIFAPSPELSLMHEKSFESLFVTTQFEGRRLICGTVYRPPRDDSLRLTCFFQNLIMVLTEISKIKNKCFIMGDFNFNLLNLLDKNTEMFTEAMFNNNFYPLINKPTRITGFHSSTIDHIWTNIMVTNITSGIIVHGVADHLPVLQVCKFGKLKICSVPKTRFFALCNIQKFKSSLESADISDIFDCTDPDSCFKMLHDSLFDEFDKNFPLTKPAKSNKRCEWYDLELRRLMLKKNRLYKKFLSRHDQAFKTRYQKIRNQYFHLISVKKKKFYLQKFENLHNNVKKSWQCFNNLLGRGRSGSAASTFCINGKMTCDPKFIANGFNDHFSNIAVDLVNQLPKSSQHFKEYLTAANPSSIFLYPTSPFEVKQHINETSPKCSAGWDEMPPAALKYLPDCITNVLSYIFNLSLCQGKFISSFKHTKLIPVYEKGDSKILINYRPISLLPSFSKILEKIVYKRLYSFFSRFNLFSNSQFGFTKGHSTSHANCLLIDRVTAAFEKKLTTLGIFLDFSKALDTIDHNITALDWFESYLTGRTQQVCLNDHASNHINAIIFSVPQGSIHGPLLFIIYVNDFPNCLKNGTSLSFAEDTSILISGNNAKSIFEKGNQELDNVGNWLIANKLSLNASKTKCVYFKTVNSKRSSCALNLVIRNKPIERVSSIRVLVTIINENLSWKDHMLSLKNKLRATLGAVIRVKPFLNKNALLVIYHLLMLSHIRYCITNWFHGNLAIVSQLQNICNKFIRLSFSLASEDDILPFMRRHNLLTIKDIFKQDVAVIMYKYHQGALPSTFDDMFRPRISSIKTRSNSQLVPAFCRCTVNQQSIRYFRPKVWSEIPIAIRKFRTICAFKKKLK